jgi:hypothetical protein
VRRDRILTTQVSYEQTFSIFSHVPVIGGAGALLFLGWGLYRRSLDVTVGALCAFVVVGLVAIPVFLRSTHHDTAVAAMIGLEAAAAVALVSLFDWFTTRRYPAFSAMAALVLGLIASVLVVNAAVM